MFDVPDNTTTESTYECMRCGELITEDHNPVTCPECGSGVQNRAMSLE